MTSGGTLDWGSGNARIINVNTYDLAFQTWNGSAVTEKMRITSAGNVGIGTATPAYKLSVEGTSTLGNEAIAGFFTATSTTATSTLRPSSSNKIKYNQRQCHIYICWRYCLTGGCITVATTTCLGMPGTVSTRWSDLVYPTASLSLGMSTHTTTFNWNTGTAGNDLFRLTTDAHQMALEIFFCANRTGLHSEATSCSIWFYRSYCCGRIWKCWYWYNLSGGKFGFIQQGTRIGAEPSVVGTLRILDSLGDTNQTGGLEFKSSITGAGYGWRITNPDIGGNYNNLFPKKIKLCIMDHALAFQGSTGFVGIEQQHQTTN